MKKLTMLKSIAAAALFAVVGMSANAQVIAGLPTAKSITTPSDTSSLKDTVSVGAIMPYFVHPDDVISHSPLYNQSGFKWNFNGGGVTGLTNGTGGSLTASLVSATGYYNDTLVVATMPATAGAIQMQVLERSNPKFSATSGCDGNLRILDIDVIKLPSTPGAASNPTQGGCSVSTKDTIKFDFSGTTAKFPVYVTYTVTAYDVNNNQIGSPSATQYYQINNASGYMILDKAADIDAKTTASGVKYTVTLGQIWDRISANATNRNALAVNITGISADILVLPTPNTGVIKHIKTL